MNSGDYDISALGRVVVDRNFQRVAIQCPDEFLGIVPDLAAQLESEVDNVKLQASTRAEGEQLNNGSPVIVVLADVASGTTCCVDDVAAEHYLAGNTLKFCCCSYVSLYFFSRLYCASGYFLPV